MKLSPFSLHSVSLTFCLAAVAGCTQHEQPQSPATTQSAETTGANAVGSVLNEALAADKFEQKAAARKAEEESLKAEQLARALAERSLKNVQTVYTEGGVNGSGEPIVELEMKIADVTHQGTRCKVAYVTNRSGILNTRSGVSLSCKW